jgi:hypothetical protein
MYTLFSRHKNYLFNRFSQAVERLVQSAQGQQPEFHPAGPRQQSTLLSNTLLQLQTATSVRSRKPVLSYSDTDSALGRALDSIETLLASDSEEHTMAVIHPHCSRSPLAHNRHPRKSMKVVE